MTSVVPKKQHTLVEADQNDIEDQEENNNENPGGLVTSHLYLKPAHTAGTLDKEAVLRRIRHRKRANRVKAAFQALLSSPFANSKMTDHNKASVAQVKWVDDACSGEVG